MGVKLKNPKHLQSLRKRWKNGQHVDEMCSVDNFYLHFSRISSGCFEVFSCPFLCMPSLLPVLKFSMKGTKVIDFLFDRSQLTYLDIWQEISFHSQRYEPIRKAVKQDVDIHALSHTWKFH